MKACSVCGTLKPLAEFYANKSAADGRFGTCKPCILKQRRERYKKDGDLLKGRVRDWQARNPERVRELQAAWTAANPDKIRTYSRRSLLRSYGLNEASFESMLESQGGCCAICLADQAGGTHNVWHIDHDHSAGEVRGLLCHRCNVGLGYFRDNPAALSAAIEYLARAPVSKIA